MAGSGVASLTDKQRFACSLVEGAVVAVVRAGAGRKLVASAMYAAVAAALAGESGLADSSDSEDEDIQLRVGRLESGLQLHKKLDGKVGFHSHYLGHSLAAARAQGKLSPQEAAAG